MVEVLKNTTFIGLKLMASGPNDTCSLLAQDRLHGSLGGDIKHFTGEAVRHVPTGPCQTA